MTRPALRSHFFAALCVALVLAPRAAQACPVCTGGQKEEVGRAFLVGSLLLSILPLVLIGAGAWWLRRRARAIDRHVPVSIASTSQRAT